jgi:hypothetical protein
MNYFEGTFKVSMAGTPVGEVSLTQEGLMTVVSCVCIQPCDDVLRLAAVCNGKYVPVGVMMPERDTLRLCKKFSRNTLALIGLEYTEEWHLIRAGDVYHLPDQSEEILEKRHAAKELEYSDGQNDLPVEVNAEVEMTKMPEMESEVVSDNVDRGETEAAVYASALDTAAIETTTVDVGAAVDDPPSAATAVYVETAAETDAVSTSDKGTAEDKSETVSAVLEGTQTSETTVPTKQSDNVECSSEIISETDGTPVDVPETDSRNWQTILKPAKLFADIELARMCENVHDALFCDTGVVVYLAVPNCPDRPFPLMPVFCFGTPEVINGKNYIVFSLKNGMLAV